MTFIDALCALGQMALQKSKGHTSSFKLQFLSTTWLVATINWHFMHLIIITTIMIIVMTITAHRSGLIWSEWSPQHTTASSPYPRLHASLRTFRRTAPSTARHGAVLLALTLGAYLRGRSCFQREETEYFRLLSLLVSALWWTEKADNKYIYVCVVECSHMWP